MKPNAEIGSLEWKTVIIDGAGKLGIEVSEEQAALFAAHAREMMLWNRRINLTALTDPYEMAIKHYLDSIVAVPFIKPKASLLDVGSGGGFPGIPLKVMLPSVGMTLLEARRKRVSFLKHVIRSLDLVDVHVIHDRLERMTDLLPSHGGFDVIVSRAFSDLELFAAHTLPLLNPGGYLVAYKGKQGDKLDAEMSGLTKLAIPGGNGKQHPEGIRPHVDIQGFVLPGLEMERTLIMVTY